MSSVRERHEQIAERLRAVATALGRIGGVHDEYIPAIEDLADQVDDLGIAMEHKLRELARATGPVT